MVSPITWIKVRFPFEDPDPYLNALVILMSRADRERFAVYTGCEFEPDDSGYKFLYLSPAAVLICEDIINAHPHEQWNPYNYEEEIEDFQFYCGEDILNV